MKYVYCVDKNIIILALIVSTKMEYVYFVIRLVEINLLILVSTKYRVDGWVANDTVSPPRGTLTLCLGAENTVKIGENRICGKFTLEQNKYF